MKAFGRASQACTSVHAFARPRLTRSATERSLSIRRRASSVGPGSAFDESPDQPPSEEEQQISAKLMSSMQEKIKAALETDDVTVADVYGNAQHVSIRVVSAQFEDKTAVQRQRLVYKARSALALTCALASPCNRSDHNEISLCTSGPSLHCSLGLPCGPCAQPAQVIILIILRRT